MEFRMEAALPRPVEPVWLKLLDVAAIAGCIPGCEEVVEEERLARYRAVMRQKVGPFKLEVPAAITVEAVTEPSAVTARAGGKDKLTGTTLDVRLAVTLAPDGDGCRLAVAADLTIAGRLASLGHSIIKKKAEENFAEFERRFRAALEAA